MVWCFVGVLSSWSIGLIILMILWLFWLFCGIWWWWIIGRCFWMFIGVIWVCGLRFILYCGGWCCLLFGLICFWFWFWRIFFISGIFRVICSYLLGLWRLFIRWLWSFYLGIFWRSLGRMSLWRGWISICICGCVGDIWVVVLVRVVGERGWFI